MSELSQIDIIKRCCPIADGFSLEENYISCGLNVEFEFNNLNSSLNWNTFFYPLLLSKAVDAILAMEEEDIAIIPVWLSEGLTWVARYNDDIVKSGGDNHKTADSAREAVLRAFFEMQDAKAQEEAEEAKRGPFLRSSIYLAKNAGEPWTRIMFDRLEKLAPEGRPFHSFERDYESMIEFDEDIEGTYEDVSPSWCLGRLIKEGLIHG